MTGCELLDLAQMQLCTRTLVSPGKKCATSPGHEHSVVRGREEVYLFSERGGISAAAMFSGDLSPGQRGGEASG